MKLSFLASACLGLVAMFAVSCAAEASVPPPWQNQDIGAVSVAGTARVAKGVFTLSGTLDIWGQNDGCHFVWQTLKGDGAVIARVLSIERTHNHAKGGLAMRESLLADGRHVTWVGTPTDGTQLLVREQPGAATTSKKKADIDKATLPVWLKLVREGDTFTGFQSTDGKAWTQTDSVTVKLSETLHVGLVASSHQKDKVGTATFDHVAVIKTGK
jgi:hypothetical protein